MTARFSFTPPRRQLSIWQKLIALCLQQLFEEHAIGAVLARRDADRMDRLRDAGVAEHIVRTRRFLNPTKIEFRERVDACDGFVNIPALVRVDHERAVRTDRLTDERDAFVVVCL